MIETLWPESPKELFFGPLQEKSVPPSLGLVSEYQ